MATTRIQKADIGVLKGRPVKKEQYARKSTPANPGARAANPSPWEKGTGRG